MGTLLDLITSLSQAPAPTTSTAPLVEITSAQAALNYLRRSGLSVEVRGDKLRLCPSDRITDAIRQFVRRHKAGLLAELIAEESRQARRLVKAIRRAGGSIAYIGGRICLRPADWSQAEQVGKTLQAVARVTAKRQRSCTAARQPMPHALEPTQ